MSRKSFIVFMAATVCVLAFTTGCNKNTEAPAPETTEAVVETTLPPETTVETTPEPQTTNGTALVDSTSAVLSVKMRGDQVDVVGEYDDNHYVIKTEAGYGLVRKELIRMDGDPEYETWTGYAYWHAEFYDNLYLTGEPAQLLATNTKIEVLDDLGYCYVVKIEEATGFIKPNRMSKWRSSSGSSNDDGGSSGGSSGGGGGVSTGQDGGDISLRYNATVQLLAAIEQTGEVTGTGTILADGTEVILGYFDRGENIPVVTEEGFAEAKEGSHTVYLDGLFAYVDEKLVSMDGVESYEEWDGYSRWSATVHDNHHLIGNPTDKLNTNTKVHVVYELENCYMVEIGETTGFMAKDMISKYRYSSGSSSDDSGGSSGGSGGSNSSGGGEEWSPPAL